MADSPLVTLPVDHLSEIWPEALEGRKVGAILHAASVASDLSHTLTRLEGMAARGQITLTTLFGPQHGFANTTQDNMIEWEGYAHPRLRIPIHSLYGEHRQPTPEMLANVEVLFLDLMDIGARYYTFIWTMFLSMRSAEEKGIPMIVADRPNPIGGTEIEGRPQEDGYLSFVGLHPIPIRHAKTIGELAHQFQTECFPNLDLTVLPMTGWDREMNYDDTGLPWAAPSPNMPTLDTAFVYPGMCLLEGTNLSEARGTTRPFEWFGAPWIDSEALAAELNDSSLPGVCFRPISFEPGFQKWAGEECHGCQLHVRDRQAFRPVATALSLFETVKSRYPDHFVWKAPPYEYEMEKLPIEILCGRSEPEIFTHTL
ncbi:MAG: DUF1343 domain-containing protein [Verrucomicrobiota bacterium]